MSPIYSPTQPERMNGMWDGHMSWGNERYELGDAAFTVSHTALWGPVIFTKSNMGVIEVVISRSDEPLFGYKGAFFQSIMIITDWIDDVIDKLAAQDEWHTDEWQVMVVYSVQVGPFLSSFCFHVGWPGQNVCMTTLQLWTSHWITWYFSGSILNGFQRFLAQIMHENLLHIFLHRETRHKCRLTKQLSAMGDFWLFEWIFKFTAHLAAFINAELLRNHIRIIT